MKKLKGYLQSSWYIIKKNKAYALFCFAGSLMTFVFVCVLLQTAYSITKPQSPFSNNDRVVKIESFVDKQGENLRPIRKSNIADIVPNLEYVEDYYVYASSMDRVWFENQSTNAVVGFVDAGYWRVNDFAVAEGQLFTDKDVHEKRNVAVLKESLAKVYFGKSSAINKTIDFQKNRYTVIGIISDFSFVGMSNLESIWLPETHDKFISDGDNSSIYVLFERNAPQAEVKSRLANTITRFYSNQNREADVTSANIHTIQEGRTRVQSGFMVSIPIIILLLLIIPGINIMSLSNANINNRYKEISIRRTVGATKGSIFFLLITETAILVTSGAIVGMLLSKPILNSIVNIFISGGMIHKANMFPVFNYGFILMFAIPLIVVFILLCGGIPAYKASKKNLVNTLKGSENHE